MVATSRMFLDEISLDRAHTYIPCNGIPIIDLCAPNAKNLVVTACEEYGFFKVVNHGISMELVSRLENEAFNFFALPQEVKDKALPPNPLGYGNKNIGHNGDMGWIEYLLFNTNSGLISHKSTSISPHNIQVFRSLLNKYISAVKRMACEVLELIADGMNIEPRNYLSKMVSDEESDSFFRLNHYPPRSLEQINNAACKDLIGFGEHTDPQIISVARSNSTSGLQIYLKNGTWLPVPPDPFSFFINVDDCLHVMTNGRLKSVKHRVVANNVKSRLSMIYFGGPPMDEKIHPLKGVMEEGEESLYKELTWSEYKTSAFKTKLGDDRLEIFKKSPS